MAKQEPQIETVKMDDDRVVDFPGKRQLLKSASINAEANSVQVRLDFRNGETRLFTVPQSLLLQFAAHGAEQKLGDEIAGLKDPATGQEASIEDKVLTIDSLMERLERGEWNERREGNGMAGASVLIRALCELRGKSVEEVKAFLAPKTHAEKLALREVPAVKAIVQRLEAEKAAKRPRVDGEALLEGF
jgi:hypothetical protein